MDDTSKELYDALQESCNSCKSNLISLSGGLDSSIIAYFLKDRKPKSLAIIAEDFVSTDLTYCQLISKEMGLPLTIYNVKTAEILEAVEQTIKILKNFNDIEIRNNVVMYLAIKWAKDNGEKSIITGDGADELFAGYNFLIHKPEEELQAEIDRVCSIMHFPTQEIGKTLGVEIESPFLSEKVINLAKKIPANLKVRSENEKKHGKWILRKTFENHIPEQIVWREKSPMQEGSGTSGLTNLFELIIEEEKYVEKKLTVEKEDNVIIRSRESMHYYEIFKKLYGSPVDKDAKNACPYCKHKVENSKFCRMCGAFPI
ncbi:asparagine synthase protein [Marine Group I thaumarchaeote SCGC AAA799-B03]|uniref:Asparagine synthase protein n=3 Tax=Marine Group I TaxID=905826 RepID=A0A087S610_9ARCH|nr:asparagine synthase protein [Marine Group I thaumarchaeote SCGC AAA799-N04]KFM17689.1 asparagine synthase protein [Marine Group I thaumarchaeote SCGC RSA3]KFM21164.1 asparagine synthase protein [Marine Group I thaumarchaeote SCGC AAA799-B03]